MCLKTYLRFLFLLNTVFLTSSSYSSTAFQSDIFYDDEKEWYRNFFPKPTCYFNDTNEEDALTQGDDNEFDENTIFFIETSCKSGLNDRQACSVESAARTHLNRTIVVLFLAPISKQKLSLDPLKTLSSYPNVQFFRIHLDKYTKGTVVERLVTSSEFKNNKFYIHKTSEILRFVTLNKFGGIYLDLDVIMLKSLDSLPEKKNWVGMEGPGEVGIGLLALSKDGIGKILSSMALRYINIHYNPYEWITNRTDVFSNILKNYCGESKKACKDFKRYEAELFYPIPERQYMKFTQPIHGELNTTGKYAYHFWNYLTGDEIIETSSLLSILAEKYCPHLYPVFGSTPKLITTTTESTTVEIGKNNDKKLLEEAIKMERMQILSSLEYFRNRKLGKDMNESSTEKINDASEKYNNVSEKYTYFLVESNSTRNSSDLERKNNNARFPTNIYGLFHNIMSSLP